MTDKKPQDVIKPERRNIHQRINAIMDDVAYVQKENKKVNDQYTFVSHDAVTAAIQPGLVNHGVVVVPSVISHSQDGNRTEVDVNVDFVNMDNPEDKISVQFFGYGVDKQDKGPGKAFSYAKKYAFLQLFCLETGDDPERDSIDHKPEEKPKKVWNGPMKVMALKGRLKDLNSDLEGVGGIDDFHAIIDEYAAEIDQVNDEPSMVDWASGMNKKMGEVKQRIEQLEIPE